MRGTGGPAAERLAALGWFVLITFIVAISATLVILVWALARRRGSLADHAPADIAGGQRWILVGGALIPAIVLGTLFVVTLRTMSAFPLHETEGPGHPIDMRIVGRQWWWQATYEGGLPSDQFIVPTEFHIPVGRPVSIALETRDVIHSFWVPKLHGKVDLLPGRVNYIQIQADEPGVYRGECAEYCGMQHAHMILLIVAEPEEDYRRWVAHQRRAASVPASDEAREGQQLFLRNACVLCHRIAGTPALGTVGPDLTHVATRRLIAGGMLNNDTANLTAWVTHAQALKPGSEMPNITAFTGEELNALVAYLKSLE
jgi:cytochrome c oxidase subunit 2